MGTEKIAPLPRPKFSQRMLTFVENALPNEDFWDICCDHGYVGIKALRSECFSKVYFVDQVPHIMERLKTLLDEAPRPFNRPFELQTKSGEEITDSLNGNVLVAGVGGMTIKIIIQAQIEKNNLQAKRLLLSPHTDEKVVMALIEEKFFKDRYLMVKKIEMEEGKRKRPLYIFDQKPL